MRSDVNVRQEGMPVPMFGPVIDPLYNMVDRECPFNCEQTFDHAHEISKENDIQMGQFHAMDAHLKELAKCKFNETDENRQEKVNEFRKHLHDMIDSDSTDCTCLLTKLPISQCTTDSQEQKLTVDKEDGEHRNDEFLLKFLRAGNHDVENAAQILINYIRLMRDHSQYYQKCRNAEVIQQTFDEKIHTVLPHRDKFGRRIFIWRPGRWDPEKVSFTDSYCAMYMLCEMMAMEPMTQITGCTVVCEGSNMGLKQLKALSIEDIRNCANFIQVKWRLFHPPQK